MTVATQEVLSADSEFATLAGGCFWCLEAAFEQVQGVERVESGYMGGAVKNPTYRASLRRHDRTCRGRASRVRSRRSSAIARSCRSSSSSTIRRRSIARAATSARNIAPPFFIIRQSRKKTAEKLIAELTERKDLGPADRNADRRRWTVLSRRRIITRATSRQSESAVLPGRWSARRWRNCARNSIEN